MRKNSLKKMALSAAAVVAGGVSYACAPVPALINTITGVNPCGTILACDPRLYNFATSGLDGPGADPDKDPFCTFPPYCTQDEDPLYGGLVGGNP